MAEGTTLLTWRGIKPLESSNLSLSAENNMNVGEEEVNCFTSERDEKDGALFREHMKPRVGVEKFFERRRKKYS